MWFVLSCAAAVSNAGYSVGVKFLPRYSGLEIATVSHIICGLLALIMFMRLGLSVPTDRAFLFPAISTIILNIIAAILLFTAIARSEISISLPFLSLTPILTAGLAYLMRGELLTPVEIAGLILIVSGTFTIEARTARDFLYLGGARVFRNRGVILVSIVAVIFGLSSVFDKNATLASDPMTFSTFSLAARGVFFLLLAFVLISRGANSHSVNKWHMLLFAGMGILMFTELLTQMWALTDAMVANVIAVKRLGMLVTSVAGFVVFKEKFTYARAAGIGMMISGSILIYYG